MRKTKLTVILIYRIEGDVLVLTLSRTEAHSDLFGKLALCRMGKPVRHFAFYSSVSWLCPRFGCGIDI